MCLYIAYYVWSIYNDKFKPQKIKNQSSYATSTKNNVIKGSLVSNYNIFNVIHLHITIFTSPHFIKPWASTVYKTIIIKTLLTESRSRIVDDNFWYKHSLQTCTISPRKEQNTKFEGREQKSFPESKYFLSSKYKHSVQNNKCKRRIC